MIEVANLSKRYGDLLAIRDVLFTSVPGLSLGFLWTHGPPALSPAGRTSALDPRPIIELRSLIRTLGAERTVVLSTHILPEVSQVCDKVVIINEGRVVLEDQLANLTRTRTLEEVFIEAISRDAGDGARARAAAEEEA